MVKKVGKPALKISPIYRNDQSAKVVNPTPFAEVIRRLIDAS